MNDKTRYYYLLAKMYEFIRDAMEIGNGITFDTLANDKTLRHAINMCFVQVGELAVRMRDISISDGTDKINVNQMIGMRNKIVHAYGDIDYKIVIDTLNDDFPKLNSYIERTVPNEILKNPYLLYDRDIEDFMCTSEKEHEITM